MKHLPWSHTSLLERIDREGRREREDREDGSSSLKILCVKEEKEVDIQDILHTVACANTKRWTEVRVKWWEGERKVKVDRGNGMEM